LPNTTQIAATQGKNIKVKDSLKSRNILKENLTAKPVIKQSSSNQMA